MSIITLTSDFGIKDHYVASVKGQVLSAFTGANIVDISHCIEPYNLVQSSYVWMGAYLHFPENTHHFILVDSEVDDYEKFIVARKNKQWIYVADNGWVSLLQPYLSFDDIFIFEKNKIYHNTCSLYLDIATQIEKGIAIEQIAQRVAIEETQSLSELQPIVNAELGLIKGAIIYDDHYGNMVTNISKQLFDEVGQGRNFEFRASRYTMNRIHKSYADFNTSIKPLKEYEGESLLIFNDVNLLQIAVYKSSSTAGTVKSLFGLRYRDAIVLQFFNEK